MSRVVVSTYVTLDGVVEDPQDWLFPFWNEEVGRYAHDQLFASDALLVGRVTYDTIRGGLAHAFRPGRLRGPHERPP